MYAEKSLNEYYCRSLASRGFTVFNISYRLAPDVTVNQQLQDAAAALKWISENIDEYPCDSGSIMLTGDSAGGQLAAYSAVLMQSSELRDIFKTVDPQMKITALLLTSPVVFMKSGAMSIYTKSLWGTNYKRLDTYRYMNFDEIIGYAQLPPTYLITSSGDLLARRQTQRLAELLKKRGIPFELKDYEKYTGRHLPHVFSVLEPFDDIGTQTINDAVKFFKNEIKRSRNTNNNSEDRNR